MKKLNPARDPDPYDDQCWIRSVKSYIESHLSDHNFHVSDIAYATLVSERQLYRRVKRITGLTPNQLVRKMRMAKARQLLQHGGDRSLRFIARKVGFLRPDYFAKLFKEEFKVRPEDCCLN